MKIRRGTTRVVLIAFGLAFKFPTLKQHSKKSRAVRFLRGVATNVTEFATYIRCGCPFFMVPVFSLGFMNIQKYAGEEAPRMSDMIKVHLQLSPKAQEAASLTDKHCFAPGNFRWSAHGLRMIDFGNARQHRPLSCFLTKYYKEFGDALAAIQNPGN